MNRLLLALLLIFIFTGCTQLFEPSYPEAHISTVIDGDTIVTSDGRTVRLLGINTPEHGRTHYTEAQKRLEALVLNETVMLEQGTENTDQYDRLLRYVHVDGTLVNRILVREGLATMYTVGEQDKYTRTLQQAQESARQERIGLWQRSDTASCVSVSTFHWDADGNDNYNLNNEYVTFHNGCDSTVDMTDWQVKDEATNTYTFSAFTLAPDASVTLYTGVGNDNTMERYWGQRRSAVWNNDGDMLFLRDEHGKLAAYESY